MESSATGHAIKNREMPNDIFYTPVTVVQRHLAMIEKLPTDKWLDPFKGKGAYFDKLPDNKEWCEITEGRDFFDYVEPVDIIVSNPPYSCLDKVLQHSVSLKPRIISYLIGQQNLTAKRIEFMNENGYGLSKVCLLKVFKWYGMSYIVVFEKGAGNCMDYDRKVHR